MNEAVSIDPLTSESDPIKRREATVHTLPSTDSDFASDPHIAITKLWMRLATISKQDSWLDIQK